MAFEVAEVTEILQNRYVQNALRKMALSARTIVTTNHKPKPAVLALYQTGLPLARLRPMYETTADHTLVGDQLFEIVTHAPKHPLRQQVGPPRTDIGLLAHSRLVTQGNQSDTYKLPQATERLRYLQTRENNPGLLAVSLTNSGRDRTTASMQVYRESPTNTLLPELVRNIPDNLPDTEVQLRLGAAGLNCVGLTLDLHTAHIGGLEQLDQLFA